MTVKQVIQCPATAETADDLNGIDFRAICRQLSTSLNRSDLKLMCIDATRLITVSYVTAQSSRSISSLTIIFPSAVISDSRKNISPRDRYVIRTSKGEDLALVSGDVNNMQDRLLAAIDCLLPQTTSL